MWKSKRRICENKWICIRNKTKTIEFGWRNWRKSETVIATMVQGNTRIPISSKVDGRPFERWSAVTALYWLRPSNIDNINILWNGYDGEWGRIYTRRRGNLAFFKWDLIHFHLIHSFIPYIKLKIQNEETFILLSSPHTNVHQMHAEIYYDFYLIYVSLFYTNKIISQKALSRIAFEIVFLHNIIFNCYTHKSRNI